MRVLRMVPMLLLLVLGGTACGDDVAPAPGASADEWVTVPLGDRPSQLYVPTSYASGGTLVVGLHGYTSRAEQLEAYLRIVAQARSRGFLYAAPEGTPDAGGRQFWNATDACCNFDGSDVDDSAYLSELIDTVRQTYGVGRVVVIGHSNGGFMAYRMACEHADQISAIASLAGVEWSDASRCTPSAPVSILQIHGTADTSIRYAGGSVPGGAQYPGAEETVARWVARESCDTAAATGATMDLDGSADGPETTPTSYSCPAGVRVALWRMQDSPHVPALTDAFTPAVLDFLLAAPAR